MIRERFDSVVSSVEDRFERLYRKNKTISSISGLSWIEFLFLAAISILLAGIVDAEIQPVSGGTIIYPVQGYQSIAETIIDLMAICLGGLGIYLSYLAGRQTTKPRMVSFYLIIGLTMLLIATYLGIYVNGAK